jgi:plasmid replication initiation protein|nr:MAG TPA: DNA REPLICATION protein [Caudoviricetes sp.]
MRVLGEYKLEKGDLNATNRGLYTINGVIKYDKKGIQIREKREYNICEGGYCMDNDKILMKNNHLIKAKYNLTLIQSRIFMVILYKLQKDNNGDMSCILTRNELKSIINKKSNHSIKAMNKILDDLSDKSIYFREVKANSKYSIWGKYNIISGVEYDEEYDYFKMNCSNRVYELLTNYLKIGYTPINLSIFLSLKSIYAQRMYDLLRLWSNSKKIITYSVAELKELMMVEDKYKNYADFQRNIITPSVKTLNSTGMFEIDFTTKKTGRTVTDIIFDVKDLDKRKYFEKKEIKNTTSMEDYFTQGTKVLFDKDFEIYKSNYNDDFFTKAFYDSVSITLDKDNITIIGNRSYNYFKKTMENKLQYYIELEVNELLGK